MTGDSTLQDALLNDTGTMLNGYTGTFDLSAVWDSSSNTMKLRATNSLTDGTPDPRNNNSVN